MTKLVLSCGVHSLENRPVMRAFTKLQMPLAKNMIFFNYLFTYLFI